MINQSILQELISKQRHFIPKAKRLTFSDMERLSKYLQSSIFGDTCAGWSGYANYNNSYQCVMFYKNKKLALPRLLYANYIDRLSRNECIRFTCGNRKCSNVTHMKKCKHSSTYVSRTKQPTPPPSPARQPARTIFVDKIVLKFD